MIRNFISDDLKRRLEHYKPYRIARDIKWVLQKELKASSGKTMVSLKPQGVSKGNVLLSYWASPFLEKQGTLFSHSGQWECLEIAKTFLDLNYCVDVIDWHDNTFLPRKDYAFFIDVRTNLQRLAPVLNENCIKIMHIDLCHMLFNNAAEANRLLALQQRKAITLRPQRFELPNWAIEHADCATVLGNEFTMNTFKYAGKPLYPVPIIPIPNHYPWPQGKDFDHCRKHYLWFGSGGFVRKGLDLVLDAFAEMPDYHLTVCGPIQQEKEFEAAYYKELYETANIHTVGWVDIFGPQFVEITRQCVGLIFPSASEGQCGGVVTCLSAGLIPVISYESGVDVNDFGRILRTCSIDEIKNSVRLLSNLPSQEVERMARSAWRYAREHHTRERFAQEYRKVIKIILEKEKVSGSTAREHGGQPVCGLSPQ